MDCWIGKNRAGSDHESIKVESRHIRDGNEKSHKYLSIKSVVLVVNQLDAQTPVHGTATYRYDDIRCCIIQF